jgi:acyl-CoA synthetase (AMP-forming)/AMP-acid ligase II
VANIASALTDVAYRRPYATAVACPAGHDRAGRPRYTHWTFRELDTESDVLARGLRAVGIGERVRTALMVKPSLEFFALTFALFKAGAVPVLIDPGMGVANLRRCLHEARPRAFIGIPKAQLARRVLGWARPWVRFSVTVNPVGPMTHTPRPARLDPTGERMTNYSLAQVRQIGLDADGEPFRPAPAVVEVDNAAGGAPIPFELTAAVLFTSGSTGPPKGVVYTHAIFQAQVALLRDLYGIEPGEVDLCTFPLFALFAPALGMTSIVPEMDATRPALVDPPRILGPIEHFGVTNLFGSPALLKRLGGYGADRGLKLPSLKRVVSAGAPVPARVLERFATMLAPGVQVFTPYGATEALPVASIGSDEILGETRHATDRGAGVCVGRPVPGMRVEVVRITDEAIPTWRDDLAVPEGTVGELVVEGPVVTREYFDRDDATAQAKVARTATGDLEDNDFTHFNAPEGLRVAQRIKYGWGVPGRVMHRMGDLGYRDAQGRLWFCGRKAHRVTTRDGTLYTIPCEAVFNTHRDVSRTALVGVGPAGAMRPVLCVEPKRWPLSKTDRQRIARELRAIGEEFAHTEPIQTFLFRRSFPVDIRHNAKIFREKLAVWAARRV